MTILTIFERCNNFAEGSLTDFFDELYNCLCEKGDEPGTILKQFVDEYFVYIKKEKGKTSKFEMNIERQNIARIYMPLVDGYIDYLSKQGLDEIKFYNKLWKFIHQKDIFPNAEVSRVVFIWMWKNHLIPYFCLGNMEMMQTDEFKRILDKLKLPARKMEFILEYGYMQKTQRARALLRILDELETDDEKSVFLAVLLDFQAKENK